MPVTQLNFSFLLTFHLLMISITYLIYIWPGVSYINITVNFILFMSETWKKKKKHILRNIFHVYSSVYNNSRTKDPVLVSKNVLFLLENYYIDFGFIIFRIFWIKMLIIKKIEPIYELLNGCSYWTEIWNKNFY